MDKSQIRHSFASEPAFEAVSDVYIRTSRGSYLGLLSSQDGGQLGHQGLFTYLGSLTKVIGLNC